MVHNSKKTLMEKKQMKKMLSFIIIVLIISCSLGVQGEIFNQTFNETPETLTTDLGDFFFDKKMEFFTKIAHYPSLSACVIKDEEVIWSNSYGFYDLTNNTPTSTKTIYNIGSITKTITGTALMQLWEQGLFNLDDDVNKYLPFSLRNPNFPEIPITFRMLLSHTSSLNPDPYNYYWFNFSEDPPFDFYPYPWLAEQLIPTGKWYNSQRWNTISKPGEQFFYANANFDIVAYLVELISGKTFITYCNDHIFSPLKMDNTGFNLSQLNINEIAIPYYYHDDGQYYQLDQIPIEQLTLPYKYWRVLQYSVGGLYTTVLDLSHFLIAHMNDGVWNNVRILQKETVNLMHSCQFESEVDYGLAWYSKQDDFFEINYSGHNGGIFGVTADMFFIPSEDIGIIYLSNSNNADNYVEKMILYSLFMKGGLKIISNLSWNYIFNSIFSNMNQDKISKLE